MAATVMIMRHAEKPRSRHGVPGRTEIGLPTRHGLSEAGWLRAHALARWFQDGWPRAGARPQAIFAAAPTARRPSTRSVDTVTPLARALGLPVRREPAGSRAARDLANVLRRLPGSVLVCWRHRDIPRLARALGIAQAPKRWPGSRYDEIWVARRRRGKWELEIVRHPPLHTGPPLVAGPPR
ncbi:hypothetical protein [Bordetella sp. 2513F-2]